MKVLLIGEKSLNLTHTITNTNDIYLHTNDRLTLEYIISNSIEFIVSYGYRHKVKEEVLDILNNKAINLHISYLPWNRGADPNFWSILENTTRGVTIHLIDKGIDTGDILIQQKDRSDVLDTFRSSYDKLTMMIEDLFLKNWIRIRNGSITPTRQVGIGSYHRSNEKNKYKHLLHSGWDTPINDFLEASKNIDNI